MNKKLSCIVMSLIVVFCMVALVACDGGGGGDVEHVHTFSSEWSMNEFCHFKESLCSHDVKSEEGEHEFDETYGVCIVCGYQKEQTDERAKYLVDDATWRENVNVAGYDNFTTELSVFGHGELSQTTKFANNVAYVQLPNGNSNIVRVNQQVISLYEYSLEEKKYFEPFTLDSAQELKDKAYLSGHLYGWLFENDYETFTFDEDKRAYCANIDEKLSAFWNETLAFENVKVSVYFEDGKLVKMSVNANYFDANENEMLNVQWQAVIGTAIVTLPTDTIAKPVPVTELTYEQVGEEYKVTGVVTLASGDLVIPATHNDLPVTSIGDNAFNSCEKLTTVVVPNGVTSIGALAFYYCNNLTAVDLPDSLTSIGNEAFRSCYNLTSLVLPQSTTSFGENVFYGCSELTVLGKAPSIPQSLYDNYGYGIPYVFNFKQNLGNDEQGLAFYLTNDDKCFVQGRDVKGGDVVVPEFFKGHQVTDVCAYAFISKRELTSIVIPNGVTSIGASAFYYCDGLREVVIPKSTANIDESAFHMCAKLTLLFEANYQPKTWDNYAYVSNFKQKLGADEQGLTYYLTNDDECVVNGKYVTVKDVNIAETFKGYTVTGICVRAFYDRVVNSSLSSIKMGNGVTSIGEGAFHSTWTLPNLTLSKNLTQIGEDAFSDCLVVNATVPTIALRHISSHKLESLTINGGEIIPDNAVREARALKTIVIKEGVTEIASGAFDNCNVLESISLPNSISKIGNNAFKYCTALKYKQQDNAKYLGNQENPYLVLVAVTNADVTSFQVNAGCKVVYNNAFANCENLQSVAMSNGVVTIANNAFKNCSNLTSVRLSSNLTNLGAGVFDNCGNLQYAEYEGAYYLGNEENPCLVLVKETNADVTSVKTNENCKVVYEQAFFDCTNLQSLTITSGVVSIGNKAFCNNANLTSVVVESGNARYRSQDNCLIDKETDCLLVGNSLGVIPSSVTSIGTCAFYGSEVMTYCKIPANVTVVGSLAFASCPNLTGLVIPYSATSVGNSVCNKQSNLIIYCQATQDASAKWDSQWNNNNLVVWNFNDKLSDGNGLDYALLNDNTVVVTKYTGEQTDVTIPDKYQGYAVVGIVQDLFGDNDVITSVVLPSGLTKVSDYAFYDCDSLVSVTLPKATETIGKGAFYSCDKLSAVEIPNGVTTIGNEAFFACNSLTTLTLPNSVETVAERAFYYCKNLTTVTIGNGVKRIRDLAFDNCDKIEKVYYNGAIDQWAMIDFDLNRANPATTAQRLYLYDAQKDGYEIVTKVNLTTATQVGRCAFASIKDIVSVTLGESVQKVNSYAFSGCENLLEVVNKSNLSVTVGSTANGYVAYYAKQVVTDESQTGFVEKDGYLFYNANGACYLVSYNGTETDLVLPNDVNGNDYAIVPYAFYDCDDLTSVVISNGVTAVGKFAFGCCGSLTKAVIGDDVTNVGVNAFVYCDNLLSVTLGASVTTIDRDAFYGCTRLVEVINKSGVTVHTDESENGLLILSAKQVLASEPTTNNFVEKDGYLFYNANGAYYLVIYNGTETDLVLPNDVNGNDYAIASSAFFNDSRLTSLVISNGVTAIGKEAFCACCNLTSVEIPANVKEINDYAFYDCDSLTTITFNGTVKQILDICWNNRAPIFGKVVTCIDGDYNG